MSIKNSIIFNVFFGVGSKCSQNLWLNIQTKVCIFRLVNHVALNINSKLGELYAKRILKKFEKKEIDKNNFENKNGSLDNMGASTIWAPIFVKMTKF